MTDTPDEAPPPEPVIQCPQCHKVIADDERAYVESIDLDVCYECEKKAYVQEIGDLKKKLADSEALVGMLQTPKKVKDGLKKDGSPDMRQTKGKALAAAAAAAVFVPVDFNDPRFNHTSRQGSISARYGLLTELLG